MSIIVETSIIKFETQEKFSKLIQNLNCNKATQQYDIPIKILKENSKISHTYYATISIIFYLVKYSLAV